MRHLLLLPLCLASLAAAELDPRQIAVAAGLEAWDDIARIDFTWTHHPSSTTRSYEWLPGDRVTVISGDERTLVPLDGSELDAAQTEAHKAFINDSYWLTFELHVAWDPVELRLLPAGPVPTMPDLGDLPAVSVSYPPEGGYTPGDRYVLYVGDDHDVVAWAFHKGGAKDPKLVTIRADEVATAGLRLPTRFALADGSLFISVSDLTVTPR